MDEEENMDVTIPNPEPPSAKQKRIPNSKNQTALTNHEDRVKSPPAASNESDDSIWYDNP